MSSPAPRQPVGAPPEKTDLERLVFFSDAVFAIAMTLLVLDLKLPELARNASRADFEAALLDRVPGFVAFVISFIVLGGAWVSHHNRFREIVRYDGRLLVINLAVLFVVAFTPVPTAIIFANTAGSPWGAITYAGTVACLHVMLTLEWWYAHHAGFLAPSVTYPRYRHTLLNVLPLIVTFLASIPVALLAGERWATLSWSVAAVLTELWNRYLRRRYPSGDALP